MRDARGCCVLYEWEHDGTRRVSTENGDAFGEVIVIYIGLGGSQGHSVDV
jgi:hypothetical protein